MNTNPSEQHATIPHLAGTHLPPIVLTIPVDFQCCVDAGMRCVTYFFQGLTTCSLHDHMAASSRVFINKIQQLLAVQGDNRPFNHQHSIDAFVAGYLGQIQQEFELLRGEKLPYQSQKNNPKIGEGSTWQHH